MEAVAEVTSQNRLFDFNYQELMALDITRPQEIIEGLICERQNVLLMGRFGVGKTMLGVQMSLSLATGKDFVGRKIPQAFKTAIVDCENDLGDVKNRLTKQHDALGLNPVDDVMLRDNWRYANAGDPDSKLYGMKLDSGDSAGLRAFVHEHDPDVLIIDNLGLVVSRGDLKESDEAKRFYASLKALRQESDSLREGVIVVMHHLTKPGDNLPPEQGSLLSSPGNFLSRARGTGRVLDFAQGRFAIAEEQFGKQTYYVVHGINRSTAPVPLILQFNPETLLFEKHEDDNLRFEQVFSTRAKGKEIYRSWPEVFTWSEAAEKVVDPKTGKPFNKDTINRTRQTCLSEGFLKYDTDAKQYRKVLQPSH